MLCNVLFIPNEKCRLICMCITSECLIGQKIMALAGTAAIPMATNTQGVLVAAPAAILESGQFLKISEVNAKVSVWIFTLDVCCLMSLVFLVLMNFIFRVYSSDKWGQDFCHREYHLLSLQHCYFSMSDFKLTSKCVSCSNMPVKIASTICIELSRVEPKHQNWHTTTLLRHTLCDHI